MPGMSVMLFVFGSGFILGSTILYRVIARVEDWQERVVVAEGNNPLFTLVRRKRRWRRWIREKQTRETRYRLVVAICGAVMLVLAFVIGKAET
jgi:hypothetical protein